MIHFICCHRSWHFFSEKIISIAIVSSVFLFSTEKIFAQSATISVSGKITDENGDTMPGASVQLKGTTIGTISDINGAYSIQGEGGNSPVLLFSTMGYITQEIPVAGRRIINVQLLADTKQLEEVVVVGYGTQKKHEITGAVVTANLNTYSKVVNNNVLDMLRGTLPGVNIGSANKAGQLPGISIRGQNTISAGTSPLIVVDNVIFSGSLNDIPTSDIESFTVLKDASAAAVYGARSANGVIIIETKKGSGINGKPKFEVNTSYGVVSDLKRMRVRDADQYLQFIVDKRNANNEPVTAAPYSYMQLEEVQNYLATPDHQPTLPDPYSLFRQAGTQMNTSLSASNKIDKTTYYIAGNITQQKGVIINDEFKRYTGRLNIQTDLTKWLTVGVRTFYTYKSFPASSIYGGGTSGSSASYYGFSPWASIKNEDGSYKQFPQTTTSFNSPFWDIPNEAYKCENTLSGIFNSTIKIPGVPGLTYQFTWSNLVNWKEDGSFYGLQTLNGSPSNGLGDRNYNRDYTSLTNNILRYNNTFAENHTIDATCLVEMQKYNSYYNKSHGENFTNQALGTYGLGNATTQTVSTGGVRTTLIGTMGRLTYSFKNKYSVTGTIRRDGYSAFSENKKYGTFPSVGVSWSLSNEPFLKGKKGIDNLALRVSYGTNGNQSIKPYQTLSGMDNKRYYFAGDGGYTVTQFASKLGNRNLGWESTTGVNAGIDFAILNRRLSGSIEYYGKHTDNLLYSVKIPTITGYDTILSNIGKLQNRGIEVALNSVNMEKGDFSWETSLAFSLNRNKVVTILGKDNDNDGVEDNIIANSLFIGKSLGSIYNYKVTGMWQQSDVDNKTIMKGMSPGTYQLQDVNEDGKITSDKDRVIVGNANPNFRWSLTNTFRYKGFSLMCYINSIWGGDNWYLSDKNTPYNDGYSNYEALNHPVYDYWTPDNTDAPFPRINYSTNAAAQYRGIKYFDRSFIKLQKLALTYDMSKIIQVRGINNAALSISADNIAMYAPYWIGMDPETDNGITSTSIPSLRTFMMVLNFNF